MATNDLLTVDEAKLYIGTSLTDNSKDPLLKVLVTSVSQALDTFIGNPIVTRAVTELHWGGRRRFMLNNYPIVGAITSITDPASNTIGTDQYVILAEQGILERFGKFRSAVETDGRQARWTIVFNAGRFTDTKSVEERYKAAAAYLVADRLSNTTPRIGKRRVGDLEITYRDQKDMVMGIPAEVRMLIGDAVSVGV